MADSVTVEVLEDFYDAGAGTYRHADETFEIEREFVENNPRLVEPVDDTDQDESAPSDESEDTDGSESDDVAEADEDEDGEDAPLVEHDPEQLTETERRIDAADYQTLRKVAGRLEDIDGRGSEDELRVALHTDVDDDRVDEAFAAVEADEG